tara:strand:+ start:17696 stop:18193 length:498 start_codon:yes stop_codon:yes gene_type:complete
MAIGGYLLFVFGGEFKFAMAILTFSLFVWLAFLNIYNNQTSRMPLVLIIFGFLVGISLFMDTAITQDMWGGYHIQPDSALVSFILLLLAMTPGLLLFYFRSYKSTPPKVDSSSYKNSRNSTKAVPEELEVDNNASYGSWGYEDLEMAYDPEMVAAYYEAYDQADE